MNPIKNKAIESVRPHRQGDPDPVHCDFSQIGKYFERVSAQAMIGKITPEVIHDINNHLTGILGYAELLSMKKIEDESIQKGLKNISFSAEKCKLLLAAILSLSRQESSVRFGDINEIIEKLIELRRCALRHQQIELVLDLGTKIPAMAVDGVKLQKALMNLMFKAEEALEKRPEGRKLIFKTHFDFLNHTVMVNISANGSGLHPDGLTRVIELFQAEGLKGLENGFELKEAMQWINEMGGSLKIDPKKGEGPVFEVLLPVKGRD